MPISKEKREALEALNVQHPKLKKVLAKALEGWGKSTPVQRSFGVMTNNDILEFCPLKNYTCCMIGSSLIGVKSVTKNPYLKFDLYKEAWARFKLTKSEYSTIVDTFDNEYNSYEDLLISKEVLKIRKVLFGE